MRSLDNLGNSLFSVSSEEGIEYKTEQKLMLIDYN